MRVYLAGATGVIGSRLLPALLAAGHEVTAATRSRERLAALESAGASATLADALDAEGLSASVARARPQAVIHELTSIPARINPRTLERDFALNDRLRVDGTANLVAAARAAGCERILAQSIAFSYAPGAPGAVHDEQDALLSGEQAPRAYRRSARAVQELERSVLGAAGVVLRYGYFYGPGSAISREGSMGVDVLHRRLPLVGGGAGVWSFIHVDDAARATVAALRADGPAVYNIVDDEPAAVAHWLPALARALGARPPRRVPAALARLLAGEYGVAIMTRAQGASNERARRELDWRPRFASWREGFRSAL